jgi:hypothetical protein
MNKKSLKSKHQWARFGLYGFWALIGILALVVLIAYGVELTSVSAQVPDGFVGPLQEGSVFGAFICSFYLGAGTLIASLMILMFAAAGIVYATSKGESSGETSGIGLAKSMIVAAITGALLYMLGLAILGAPCGEYPSGGLIGSMLEYFNF